MATHSQYSYLEDSMDRGPCRAAVHGVSKSQTQLSDLTLSFSGHQHPPLHYHRLLSVTIVCLSRIFYQWLRQIQDKGSWCQTERRTQAQQAGTPGMALEGSLGCLSVQWPDYRPFYPLWPGFFLFLTTCMTRPPTKGHFQIFQALPGPPRPLAPTFG